MNLPETIKIGGFTYKVVYQEDREVQSGSSQPANCHLGFHKIWINKNQCDEEILASLLHEVLEAMKYHYDLGLVHKDLTILESTLFQVLKDNPIFKEIK